LELLRRAKEMDGGILTKSGIIVGMGETWEELLETMADLRSVSCDLLTIGQYLRPSKDHLPIDRYYTPEEFHRLKEEGLRLGFRNVQSGPMVRSSYHAWEQAKAIGSSD
ncbi:MAG: lipA, partial [Dehalococcoidia bacterium]|nr:lipA [Dehalococcoidia bacterium]